jgi:hypothetical protein
MKSWVLSTVIVDNHARENPILERYAHYRGFLVQRGSPMRKIQSRAGPLRKGLPRHGPADWRPFRR